MKTLLSILVIVCASSAFGQLPAGDGQVWIVQETNNIFAAQGLFVNQPARDYPTNCRVTYAAARTNHYEARYIFFQKACAGMQSSNGFQSCCPPLPWVRFYVGSSVAEAVELRELIIADDSGIVTLSNGKVILWWIRGGAAPFCTLDVCTP
jgi:hypothetical protein